jgi:hypothetical protein
LSCKNVEEIESLMKFKEIYKQLKNNAWHFVIKVV